jgi:RNA polymerase sigma factor (sigma-70 family)
VADLHGGSETAFSVLVGRLTPALIGFLVGTWKVAESDAEEIASDVFWTVHESIHRFRHGGSAKLTTWIFEIAKNRAIDFLRKKAAFGQEVEITDRISAVTGPPAKYAGRNKELVDWLKEQLSGLSDCDQDILKWRALDFPYAEIAPWLGISEGAARVRYKRALDKLIEAGRSVLSKDAHE